MKKNTKSEEETATPDELLPEYHFDYRQAKPNRFAPDREQHGIVLDPDVAEVFTNSEAVNKVLRALIAAMPQAA